MAWTDSQKRAIEAKGNNFLVSAAAGSGKTSVLAERVKKLILEDRVDLDSMLIVTFTNAAAAEMKHRIYGTLSERLAAERDPAEQKRLRAQLSGIGRANISTFSSFALEIVHRYYHVIGIQPGLGICDESRQEVLMREAMDELMEERYASQDGDFRAFLDCYARPDSDEPVRGMILSFHKVLQSLPYPDEWMDSLAGAGDTDVFLDFAARQASSHILAAISYFEKACEELSGLPRLEEKVRLDMLCFEAAHAHARTGDFTGALDALPAKFTALAASKAEKADWEAVKEVVQGLRANAKKHLDAAKKDYLGVTREELEKEREMGLKPLQTLISLAKDFSARYGAKKALLGLLDFGDIEHFALQILKDENVRREYREKFSCIFVDEYQDSNMVQEELIRSVSRGDNVFMVGDVKQSIYKFRLAEPELFLRKAEAFRKGDGGELIALNSNFRSKSPVIALVNRVFEQLMTRESCGMDYTQDQRLVEGAPYEGEHLYPPRFYLVDMAEGSPDDPAEAIEAGGGEDVSAASPSVDEEIEELKAAELEALQAARLIREYHGKTIHDGKVKDPAKQDRPLAYRDMAVLMRATKNDGEVFYKTFLEAGIPVYLERSEGYFAAVEIQVFLNLLRIIDNRSQDVPLLSVLRAPVFGFRASDLADIRIWAMRRGETRAPYNRIFAEYCAEGPEGPLRDRCAAFAANLDRWRREAQYEPLGDFLWQLLDETGYAAFAGAAPEGVQRLANLRTLTEKAQEYDAKDVGGLYGFINYVDAIAGKDQKVSVGQAKVMSESEDVVRIMTIHKSKGLEFPFVLLAGLGKSRNNRQETSLAAFHKDMGVSLRLVNPKTGLYHEPLSMDLIRSRKKAEELAEEVRVLYVALTRPKDILLMTAAAKNADSKRKNARCLAPSDIARAPDYATLLLSLLGEDCLEIVLQRTLQDAKKQALQESEELAESLRTGFHVSDGELDETLRAEIASRLAFDNSAELAEQEKRKYSVSQIARMAREKSALPRRLEAEGLSPDDPAAGADAGVLPDPGAPAKLPVFLSGKRRMSAAARGTAYHSVMEHLPFTWEAYEPAEVSTFMDGLLEKHILTEDERSAVDPGRICAFFGSAVGLAARKAAAAGTLRKEAPFTMSHELDGRTVLVQGTIDCYFEEDGGWVLVDYKSNYIDRSRREEEMARLRAEYLPQLALYREALEGITQKPVRKAVLYLFGIDEEISIDDQEP